ncbi:MAG: Hsp20/alpha crystallin family protein [Verrucomicrobia subdivision 3 bacterium]|nr:Hsp20/alpha crystallin family protein [Limisphaerales bacterium]
MTLTRWQRPGYWDPVRQLSTLREEIDRLFESPLSWLENGSQPFSSGWLPAIDLYEDKDNVFVRVELPGIKKEEIDISLHEGVLTLSGERRFDKEFDEAETHRMERFAGRFQRSISLPAPVDAAKVRATYKDGVLAITLPKQEEAKPKQIAVNVD